MADKRPFRRPREHEPEEVLSTLAAQPQALPRFRKSTDGFTRSELVNAFRNSFQLIGGVDALTLWAADNQTEFYKLFSKLFPAATITLGDQAAIIIQHAIPPTMLDAHPTARIEHSMNQSEVVDVSSSADIPPPDALRPIPPEE